MKIRPWLDYLVEEAGLLGVVGASLLVFAAAYFFSALEPLVSELSSLKAEYATATKEAQQLGRTLQGRTNVRDRVKAFYEFFPSRRDVPRWLAVIYKLADEEELALSKGEYRYKERKEGRLESMEIVLPVKGSYEKVRRFTARVLFEVPVLALDEIEFSRKEAGEGEVEANIRFTLFSERGR